jgi:membrane protein implicated in regulation of membrane protease activity
MLNGIDVFHILRHYGAKEVPDMKYVWLFGAVAAIYGAIAGSFFEKTPLTAVAFGLLAIVFALAAWRDIAQKA